MKKRILVIMTCILLVVSNVTMVWGTEIGNANTEGTVSDDATTDAIDLSIHQEKEGLFTSNYTYENPFKGEDTSNGVTIEFHAKTTGDLRVLGTIFAITGTGDHDGKMYFTPGSYLGFNSPNYGGYFDANMKDYALVDDFIKQEATIKIEINPKGFRVFSNDQLCYDQSILDDAAKGGGDYNGNSDFTPVLNFLANAEYLYFGYGSFWNTTNADEANIELSGINFSLMNGTVLLNQFSGNQVNVSNTTVETTQDTTTLVDTSNLKQVDSINIAIHKETEGTFTPIYTYENPFKGQDTSNGVSIQFTATSTWEISALSGIFGIAGTGENDGKFYFTGGSYLGFNSGNYGGYFDANLKDYLLVEDFIKEKATIKIEVDAKGFRVYSDGTLCYDQSILDDSTRAAGAFTGSSDFSPVLAFLANADYLYFGYGAWWNNVNADEAYFEISDINFSLLNGTVLLDKLMIDEALVKEATEISEKASAKSKVSLTIPEYSGQVISVLSGLNDLKYTKSISTYFGFGILIATTIVCSVIIANLNKKVDTKKAKAVKKGKQKVVQ